jgi:hypothetical protein
MFMGGFTMSSVHHPSDSVNSSNLRSIRLDFEQIKMLEEAAENPAGFALTKELEKASGLSRATTLKYAAVLVKNGLLIRRILPGSENKHRPTYIYTLASGITKSAIKEALFSKILKLSQEQKSFNHNQKGEINEESHQQYSDKNTESLQTETTDNVLPSDNTESWVDTVDIWINTDGNNTDDQSIATNPRRLRRSRTHTQAQLNSKETRIVTTDEILEVLEETIDFLLDRISKQDERISQLEGQVSMLKSARSARDPKEILRNIQSKFNRESGNTTNGNGKIFN